MATISSEKATVLTNVQLEMIKDRAADEGTWRDDADLERRRHIAAEVQEEIKRSGVLEGETIDHKTFCELVSLQWQIQNLNPMQMPRLLGLYHYKTHFRDFEGTIDDLRAIREASSGDPEMYEGADLKTVSESLRLIASDSLDNQYAGARKLLDQPGAGPALVSGFLHLLKSTDYALINNASTAPFTKDGWLDVSAKQRTEAKAIAFQRYAAVADAKDRVLKQVFRWQIFLDEVVSICGFPDFHAVDQFIWTFASGDRKDPRKLLEPILANIDNEQENVRVRADAEQRARKLVDANLGSLTTDQFSELFELINTCVGKKGIVYTRFSPAFVGHNANQLIERAGELNVSIRKLWTSSDEDLPKVLDQFWEQEFAGGGRSFPTAILYLRDKERYAVWTANLERALYSVVSGMPAKIRTGFSYLQYCDRLQRLRKLTGFPPELHDWVLFKVFTEKSPPLDLDGNKGSGAFTGFTLDTFRFMADLKENNNQTWFLRDPDNEPDDELAVVEERISIADLAATTYMEEEFFARLDQYLRDKQQMVFFGPPGTGKTFVALEYAKYLAQDGGEVRTVQFHPSYGYEDFMEGLRPITREGQLTYEVEDGIFKRLCDAARANPGGRYVLLVDEINRGNLPRIFGELLFLLERREETTWLPYSKRAFSIPHNIVILGTMNSSDRSIALMDLALRRRFHFVPMEPRGEVLLAWLREKKKPLWVKDLFDRLNDALRSDGIDDDHLVGHAHFMSTYLDDEFLELIWQGTIEPMLREYFFTEPNKLARFRFDAFTSEFGESEPEIEESTAENEDDGEDADDTDPEKRTED